MPRRKSHTLTEGEQRLMEVLWKRGSATVAEVIDDLPQRDRPAFNTVQTILRIMERKKYVRHREAGRAFVYIPAFERVDAERTALRQLLKRFFHDSASQLTVRLLEDEKLSSEELNRVRSLIDEAAKQ